MDAKVYDIGAPALATLAELERRDADHRRTLAGLLRAAALHIEDGNTEAHADALRQHETASVAFWRNRRAMAQARLTRDTSGMRDDGPGPRAA